MSVQARFLAFFLMLCAIFVVSQTAFAQNPQEVASPVLADDTQIGWSLLFAKGGTVTWVIALLSAIGVPILGFKIMQFSRARLWRGQTLTPVLGLLREGDLKGFRAQLETLPHPAAELLLFATMQAYGGQISPDTLREELTRRAQNLLRHLRDHVWVMELIATTAPLLGLLGTVLGMIVAFQGVEQGAGGANSAGLATGIWEALLTTAFGLAVALPFSMAASVFTNLVDRVQDEIEDALTEILVRADLTPETENRGDTAEKSPPKSSGKTK